jgi:hypothetical protein
MFENFETDIDFNFTVCLFQSKVIFNSHQMYKKLPSVIMFQSLQKHDLLNV